MTYRREQKAIHELCKRVKGDAQDVVVACGAAKFGSTMRGLRGVPIKRFYRELGRYATIVWVDEYLTSQVCSKCSEVQLTGRKKKKKSTEKKEKKKSKKKARKRRRERRRRGRGEGGDANTMPVDEEVTRER